MQTNSAVEARQNHNLFAAFPDVRGLTVEGVSTERKVEQSRSADEQAVLRVSSRRSLLLLCPRRRGERQQEWDERETFHNPAEQGHGHNGRRSSNSHAAVCLITARKIGKGNDGVTTE